MDNYIHVHTTYIICIYNISTISTLHLPADLGVNKTLGVRLMIPAAVTVETWLNTSSIVSGCTWGGNFRFAGPESRDSFKPPDFVIAPTYFAYATTWTHFQVFLLLIIIIISSSSSSSSSSSIIINAFLILIYVRGTWIYVRDTLLFISKLYNNINLYIKYITFW